MADNYILYPATIKGLASELKRALDSYANGEVSNTELTDLILAWKGNCDFMVQDGKVAPGVVGYIGKRRASIVERILNLS